MKGTWLIYQKVASLKAQPNMQTTSQENYIFIYLPCK